MAEQNKDPEEEDLQAPERLIADLNLLQNERIFVPPTVDEAVLRRARKHVRLLARPRSRWKPRLSWAAMAACLALTIWLGERFGNPTRARLFAREDINRDGRVDVLDAFTLARQIETGGTPDLRWDINGDGRVDRADVNAIAALAVNLAQAGPAPKRSAELKQHPEGAQAVWRTEVRAPFFGLLTSPWDISIRSNRCGSPRFCGARLCEPQHVESDQRAEFFKTLSGRRSSCGSKTRPPSAAAPQSRAVAQSCTWPTVGKRQCVGPIARPADCKSAIRQIENLRYETDAYDDERAGVAFVAQSCTLPYRGFVIRGAWQAPERRAGSMVCRLVLSLPQRHHASENKGSHS